MGESGRADAAFLALLVLVGAAATAAAARRCFCHMERPSNCTCCCAKQDCDGEQRGSKRVAARASRWMLGSTQNGWVDRAAAHDGDRARRRLARTGDELERTQDEAVTVGRALLGDGEQRGSKRVASG